MEYRTPRRFWGVTRYTLELRRRRRTASLVWVLIAAVGAVFLPEMSAGASIKEVRRVLIVNELGLASPVITVVDERIRAGLERSPYQIELYSEYLETTLFPDAATQREFREWYLHKYQNRVPDVIIAVGPSPIDFLMAAHEKFFPGVPIIFCVVTEEMTKYRKLDPEFTGIWEALEPAKALETAVKLQPTTKHVAVVGGVAGYDRYIEAIMREGLRKYDSRFDVSYLTDLDMPTLLERLRRLPKDTVILYAGISEDGAGTHYIDVTQSTPMVAEAANAPVFSMGDLEVGRGPVGGYLTSYSKEADFVVAAALRILNGEKPENIPVVRGANINLFDWRALQRWGLKESNLPAGSIVLNRQPTVWESYQWYIIGGISLLLVQMLLIFGLILQRARRRKTENELAITYDRLRLSVEAGKSVGWEWDVKSERGRWFGDLETMFGIPSDSYSTKLGEFRRRVYPEDRELVWKTIADARQSRGPYSAEFRVFRNDGTIHWITARGKFYYAENGDAERMLGMAVDITEHKDMEQQVRESEQRFRLVANTAPVMIWMSGPDKLCNYFNQPWLQFTGRSLEKELGNGWAEGVHREDLDRCLKTYTESFDRRESFEMQYRLRRHDGEYRWVIDFGVPRLNSDGSLAGYIGSCIDITERKLAEEALANIGRRLIEAHEEERTWIARELHDDINQRIALLAIELDQHFPECDGDMREHVRQVRQRLSDIGKDIQALSHRLHSSKLEYLGIVVAASSFCKEFSEQRKVQVDFTHAGVPRSVPKEISLCLFRVLQEALQNAAKHSGRRRFKVELHGTPEEILLTVSDPGLGFDQQETLSHRGLGLISMRERLQMVGGAFSIMSQPGSGTTISARVPLKTEERRAGVAG